MQLNTFWANVIVIYVFTIALSSSSNDVCSSVAKCVVITRCPTFFSLLLQPPNERTTLLLKSRHCGFAAREPQVCCRIDLIENTILNFTVEQTLTRNLLPDWKECGIQNTDKIIGGTKTELDEHPWMALLGYETPHGFGFHCAGMLISSRYVLTAAHCWKGIDLPDAWNLTTVRLGEWNMSSENDCLDDNCSPPVLDEPIEEIIVHEEYDAADINVKNDVAIIRLTRDIHFNDFVKPICLPLSPKLRKSSFEDLRLEVAGWGKTNMGSDVGIKLKVKVPVKKNKECAEMYKRLHLNITDTQICAGGESGHSSCLGDSGGPLMGQISETGNWIAVGIVSYGPSRCGVVGWLGVYTRITAYVDWIKSKLRP